MCCVTAAKRPQLSPWTQSLWQQLFTANSWPAQMIALMMKWAVPVQRGAGPGLIIVQYSINELIYNPVRIILPTPTG